MLLVTDLIGSCQSGEAVQSASDALVAFKVFTQCRVAANTHTWISHCWCPLYRDFCGEMSEARGFRINVLRTKAKPIGTLLMCYAVTSALVVRWVDM